MLGISLHGKQLTYREFGFQFVEKGLYGCAVGTSQGLRSERHLQPDDFALGNIENAEHQPLGKIAFADTDHVLHTRRVVGNTLLLRNFHRISRIHPSDDEIG